MADEHPDDAGEPVAPSAVFTEATHLFNLWLLALDAMVAARSQATGDAAQAATAALLTHLDAHRGADDLKPVRERLGLVFQRLREDERGRER